MCDYSLHLIASRPAKVADKLVSTDFTTSITRGFTEIGKPDVAVCLRPGTEIAFDDAVLYDRAFSMFGKARIEHRVARFRQLNMDDPHVHHDALEFPGGQIVMVTRLLPGQTATVLQLPADPLDHGKTDHDKTLGRAGHRRRSATRSAVGRLASWSCGGHLTAIRRPLRRPLGRRRDSRRPQAMSAERLFVVLPQIVVQRGAACFLKQGLQHHILAAALGEAVAVFLAERGHLGVAVLALDPAALVAVPIVEAAFGLRHLSLLQELD